MRSLVKYIFEDADEIKNIFHFDEYQDAVEFILKRHEIISIDYKKLNKKPIYLVGSGKGKNSVEFPYLGKDQKIMIVRDGEGDCELINLEGFSLTVIDDKQTKDQSILPLEKDAIYRMQHDDLRVFVRWTKAPPKVLTESFFKNDPVLWKYLGVFSGQSCFFYF